MTAGSGAARPGTAGGHCRVTVVAPTRRVDVALPEDVPLAELLPELLRLVGAPAPATGPAALNGYVLTGFDGTALDTASALSDQGIVHGGILRLRPAHDVPEAAVHDDIADAVAEAVLAGGSQWNNTALRATALTVVGIAAGLGAVVLWFSGTGTFHGWKGVIAGVMALLLFTLGVLRARYDPTAVGRGSYYGYGDEVARPESAPRDSRRGPSGQARYDEPHEREDHSYSDSSDSWDDFESHYSPDVGSHYSRDPRDPRDPRDSRRPRDPDFDPDARYGSGYGREPWNRFGDDYSYGRDPRRSFDDRPDYGRDPRDPGFDPDPWRGAGDDPEFDRDLRRGFGGGQGYGRDPRDGGYDPRSRHDFGGEPGYSRDTRDFRYQRDPRDPRYGTDPRQDPHSGPAPVGRRRFLRGRRLYSSAPDFIAPAASFDLSSFGADRLPGQRGAASRSVGATTVALATSNVRTGGLGSLAAWPTVAEAMAWATGAHHQRDYTAASVLTAASLPYAFIAGAGILPAHAADGHGLGRVHFTAGAIAVLIVALAAVVGLGRRISVPVAGVTVGLIATLTGVGLQLTKASPAAGIAVATAVCALAVELLPFAAMAAARFVIEPPTSGVEPGDFEGSPVNNYAVGLRVARTLDMLTGLTAGVGVSLVLSVALLVTPISAMQTAPEGEHTVWEQALALLASGVMLCRARLFRERAQVLAAALSGLAGLVVAFVAMASNAEPDLRALWLAPLLVVIALLALGLASIRPRRGTPEPILPPRWSRAVDFVESGLFLAVLPVLMAVLGVYGQVRNLKG